MGNLIYVKENLYKVPIKVQDLDLAIKYEKGSESSVTLIAKVSYQGITELFEVDSDNSGELDTIKLTESMNRVIRFKDLPTCYEMFLEIKPAGKMTGKLDIIAITEAHRLMY